MLFGRQRADGVLLPREQTLRGGDDVLCFGTFAVARTCDRMPGSREFPAGRPGQPPRAVRLVRPAGVDDRVRGRIPLQGACELVEPLFALEVAERVAFAGRRSA